LAKLQCAPFEVRGTGAPLRQFIFAQDLAILILASIDRLKREMLIIAPSEEYSIKDVATLIAQEYNYEDKIVFNSIYSDGQYKKTANNAKLLAIFPEFKFTSIEQGIRDSVDYFKYRYNDASCRK
jgi:GDP-L-fucose synthase